MKYLKLIFLFLPLVSQASEYLCEGSIVNFDNKWKLESKAISLPSTSQTEEGNIAVLNETMFTLYEGEKNGERVLVISAQKDLGLKPYAEAIGSLDQGVIYEEVTGFVSNKIVCTPKISLIRSEPLLN